MAKQRKKETCFLKTLFRTFTRSIWILHLLMEVEYSMLPNFLGPCNSFILGHLFPVQYWFMCHDSMLPWFISPYIKTLTLINTCPASPKSSVTCSSAFTQQPSVMLNGDKLSSFPTRLQFLDDSSQPWYVSAHPTPVTMSHTWEKFNAH